MNKEKILKVLQIEVCNGQGVMEIIKADYLKYFVTDSPMYVLS